MRMALICSVSSCLFPVLFVILSGTVGLYDQVLRDVGKAADWDGWTISDPTLNMENSLMMKIGSSAASLLALEASTVIFLFHHFPPFFFHGFSVSGSYFSSFLAQIVLGFLQSFFLLHTPWSLSQALWEPKKKRRGFLKESIESSASFRQY